MKPMPITPDWIHKAYAAGMPPEVEERIVSISHLFWEFETIGTNCRFGFVQRAYKCEPISLLRWAGSPVFGLLKAIDHRWAGIDDPQNMALEYRKELGHFLVMINTYNLVLHTSEQDASADQDALKQKIAKQNAFLLKKLLSDLSNAEKHLVVFSDGDALDEADVEAISSRIAGFSPANKLLFVHRSTSSERAGEIDVVSPSVLRGRVRKVDETIEGGLIYPDWIALCTAAKQYWAR